MHREDILQGLINGDLCEHEWKVDNYWPSLSRGPIVSFNYICDICNIMKFSDFDCRDGRLEKWDYDDKLVDYGKDYSPDDSWEQHRYQEARAIEARQRGGYSWGQ